VADKLFGHGEKHNPNVELIGQGVANFFSPLVGGLPATGAIARTATNIRSGAKSPVAGMVHALTLLAILMFAAPLARFVPLSVLAAILLVVAYNMGEWSEIPELLKLSRLEAGTWAATFLLTVFADLTVAVEAGMIMAALVFIRKVTQGTTIAQVTDDYVEQGRVHILQDKEIPSYVTIFRIHGPFLFGAADKIDELVQRIPELPPILILRLRNMTAIDATGLRALENLADRVQASGRGLIFCGAPEQPALRMKQADFEKHVGAKNICANIAEALERARALYPQIAERAPHVMHWGRRESDRTMSPCQMEADTAVYNQ
jgi:SulP family sulfate permease